MEKICRAARKRLNRFTLIITGSPRGQAVEKA